VFDGQTGELRKVLLPPWRIAVCLIGLMVTALSVTGVLIWMRKRQARGLATAKLRRRSTGSSHTLGPGVEPALPLRGD